MPENILSIVVTTRNRYKDLMTCVDSLYSSKVLGFNLQLVIVDDCSTDETARLSMLNLTRYLDKFKKISVFHNKSVKMMVESRNIGFRSATGKYVLFVDDDNIVDSELISILYTFFENHEDAGIIGPAMYYADKTKYMDFQKISLITGHTVGVVSPRPAEFYETEGVPNVFMIRKTLLKEIGEFDASLVQTYTEPDYSLHAKKHGFKSFIVPAAITYHQINKADIRNSKMLGGKFSQKAYFLMRNRCVLVSRYGNIFQKLLFFTVFSWMWPTIYTKFMLSEKRYDLIKLYWLGWWHGIVYFVTGKFAALPKFE